MFWDCLKWACRGNTEFRISRMSSSSFVFVSFILSRVLGSGGVLGFCVLPGTPEGTRKVPRSGKFARWAFRCGYEGDVTVMKSRCLFVGGMSPRSSSFVRMCGLLSSVELGRTLFKWARFTRSAIEN